MQFYDARSLGVGFLICETIRGIGGWCWIGGLREGVFALVQVYWRDDIMRPVWEEGWEESAGGNYDI